MVYALVAAGTSLAAVVLPFKVIDVEHSLWETVFAGAFDAGARAITENMKLAAARALSDVVADALAPEHIVPTPFDPRVAPAVTAAVAEQARLDGVARVS